MSRGRRSKRRRTKSKVKVGFGGKLKIARPMDATTPLAAGRLVKFKYVQAFNMNPGAVGLPSYHVFRANSLYDPDLTGTGHQPRGYDQWCPVFYNNWVIVGAKITVRFVSTGETTIKENTYMVGITLSEDTVVPSSAMDEMEKAKSSYRTLTNSGSSGKAMVSKGYSAKKFWKQKDLLGDPNQRGVYNANPSKTARWTVWAAPFDGATDCDDINAIASITYIAKLSTPVTVSAS